MSYVVINLYVCSSYLYKIMQNSEKSIPMISSISLTFSGKAFTLGMTEVDWERLESIGLNSSVFFAFFICQVTEKTLGLSEFHLYLQWQ